MYFLVGLQLSAKRDVQSIDNEALLKQGGRLVSLMLVLVKSITCLLVFNEQGLRMVACLSFLDSTTRNEKQICMEELDFFLSKDRAFLR